MLAAKNLSLVPNHHDRITGYLVSFMRKCLKLSLNLSNIMITPPVKGAIVAFIIN